MDIDKTFGIRLRIFRKHRGISQEKLAEYANRSVEAISNLERGLSLPSYEMIMALADALAIPAADFFQTEGETPARAELISTLLAAVSKLSDRDLDVAVELLTALNRRRE